MELIKLPLSDASGIFNNPLVTFLPLFGFAHNLPNALKRVREGEIKVNGQPVNEAYVLQRGDLVTYEEYGIIIEEQK